MNSKDRILAGFRNSKSEEVGVWFMRQAGRFLPDYRKLRGKYSFEEMCKDPELIREVTLLPLRYMDVDALIIFSDILTPLWGCGIDLKFVEGGGPLVGEVDSYVEALKRYDFNKNKFLFDGIKLVKNEVKDDKFLLGFSAAPFTFLAYLLEGGHSRNFLKIRSMIYERSDYLEDLFEITSEMIILYLEKQFEAGVDGAQIFDSWIGYMGRERFIWYKKFLKKIFKKFEGKNLIYFPLNSVHIMKEMVDLSVKVISVDWRCDISYPVEIGFKGGIQGNLDPAIFFLDEAIVFREVEKILMEKDKLNGFIFNTGHGLHPETPYNIVKKVVDFIHQWR